MEGRGDEVPDAWFVAEVWLAADRTGADRVPAERLGAAPPVVAERYAGSSSQGAGPVSLVDIVSWPGVMSSPVMEPSPVASAPSVRCQQTRTSVVEAWTPPQ
jgi:hypothetical protein